jgi:hypothetical protein
MRLQRIREVLDGLVALLAWPAVLVAALASSLLYAEYRKTDPPPEYESLLDLVDHEDQHSGA